MTALSHRSGPLRPLVVLAVLVTMLLTVLAVGAGAFVSPASAGRYTPAPGIRTNNPLGDLAHRRVILRQIIRTIDSTPRHGKIDIASWNIRSDAFVDALIRAHRKRDITVRVIVDRLNANPNNPNHSVNRLQRALAGYGNKRRPPELRSKLKRCYGSCRGRRGIAHSKFFLFERAGNAQFIVMNGSANATDLAANAQWNDLYTVLNRPGIYNEYLTVFNQMLRDRTVAQGYRIADFGGITTMFYPYTGEGTEIDPIIRELNRVRCAGARNTGDGRTIIKVAMTSVSGERGKKIAWKIRALQNQGCHVRIVYAVMGNEVLRILRREGSSPVPLQQIVQDFNDDGVYDRYLHMKVLTIRGVYERNPNSWVTINGSANWSPTSLGSDEAVMRLNRPQALGRYNGWIDYLFHHPPPNPRPTDGTGGTGVTGRRIDPYSQIEID